jgi:FMN phosphatase YigB (HAD superfamily)
LRLAVASSSAKDLLKRLLNIVGAPDVFEKRASGDDAEDSKPDPDIVHAALDGLQEPPDVVAMIGDHALRRRGRAAREGAADRVPLRRLEGRGSQGRGRDLRRPRWTSFTTSMTR